MSILERDFISVNSITNQPYHYNDIPKRSEKSSTTTISTDEVDSEIEQLKSKRLELKKSLQLSDNENVQMQLNQIETELQLKDNDEYRKQHSKVIDVRI